MTFARLLCVVAAALVGCGCGESQDLPQPVVLARGEQPATSISEIVLKRSACFGTCPVYTVQYRRDGVVAYTGEQHVEHLGERQGRISVAEFAMLAAFLEQQGFTGLEAWYRAGGTDLPTSTVTVIYEDGRSKTVSDYGSSGPPALWAIHRVLDGVLARARWGK